jgi:hypothetical protein
MTDKLKKLQAPCRYSVCVTVLQQNSCDTCLPAAQASTDPAQSSGRVQSRVLLPQGRSEPLRTVSNKYNALLVALGGSLVYKGPADGPGLSRKTRWACQHEKQIHAGHGVCTRSALVAHSRHNTRPQRPPQHMSDTASCSDRHYTNPGSSCTCHDSPTQRADKHRCSLYHTHAGADIPGLAVPVRGDRGACWHNPTRILQPSATQHPEKSKGVTSV